MSSPVLLRPDVTLGQPVMDCADAPSADGCLHLVASHGQIGFIRWQADRSNLHVDEAARRMLGRDADASVRFRHLAHWVGRDEWKRIRPQWEQAVRQKTSSLTVQVSIAGRRQSDADGRLFKASIALTYAPDGALYTITLAVEDLAIVKALSESEERLRQAQDMARVGYWEWDFLKQEGKFSPGALALLERPENWKPTWEDIKGLTPDDQSDWMVSLYQEAWKQKLPTLRYEVRYAQPDGSSRYLHSIARIEYNRQGNFSRFVVTFQDVSEVRAYRRQVHSLSYFDPLTKLPNRALFMDRLREACAEASRQEQQLGVLMLDIDRFKDINESLGHAAGDTLLQETSERLHQVLRGYDTVGRLGGDEFAVVLPEVRQPGDIGGIAQKVMGAFVAPFMIQGREVFVSTSIGGALYPSHAKDVDQLMQYADAALYHAKAQGRNNFQLYSPGFVDKAAERLALEGELRRGLERGELELFYQPKFDLATGGIVGAEALMRWNHPLRGRVSPQEFIPLAEDTGLINPMGEWALNEVCRRTAEWNAGKARPLKIAVNLSARQLAGGNFADTVRKALSGAGCLPAWLELEITESLLLDGRDDVKAVLQEIADMGITIAIDDFGIGYSALSYLTRFPIHILKIDRSFVSKLPDDNGSAELVKAIVSLGRSLKMKLVAEGVETPEQASFLKGLGCEMVQGFLYGKPMSQADFVQVAERG